MCLLVLLIYLVPYVYYGTDATLWIRDNLDSHFVWYKVLLENGALFADNDFAIERLNGLPRSTLPSELDAFVLLYTLFGAVWRLSGQPNTHYTHRLLRHVFAAMPTCGIGKKKSGHPIRKRPLLRTSPLLVIRWARHRRYSTGRVCPPQPRGKGLRLVQLAYFIPVSFLFMFCGQRFFLLVSLGLIWLWDLITKVGLHPGLSRPVSADRGLPIYSLPARSEL